MVCVVVVLDRSTMEMANRANYSNMLHGDDVNDNARTRQNKSIFIQNKTP
jgi:hypothetical protein